MSDGPYDDDFSAEEQAALDGLAESDRQLTEAPGGRVPGILEAGTDEDNAASIAEAEARSAALRRGGAPEAPAEASTAAAEPPVDPPGETLEAFIERHKDKPPAELATLLQNRDKRAAREGYVRRQRGRTPEQIQADRNALAQRRQQLAGHRSALEKAIEEDPDTATRALAAQQHQQELDRVSAAEAALDREAYTRQIDEAIDFGNRYIADFPQVYPQMREFANAVGYTDQELDGVADGRDLVVLNLARLAANLIQGQRMDVRGNLLPEVKPVADTITDPRLRAPPAPATHSAPANAPKPPTLEAQRSSVMRMSDADFNKLSDADLARLMGA